MNGLEYTNHQVFILNGQPVIIQRNQDEGIINDNGSISLRQNSFQASHSHISESNETSQFDINRDAIIQEATDEAVGVVNGNQFVTYVGESDDEDVPTIHITLEQAAELGLQFDNDDMKLDTNVLPIVADSETIDQNKQLLPFNVFSSKTATVSNEDLELAVFSDRKIISDSDVCDNATVTNSKSDVASGDGFKMTVDEPAVDGLQLDGSDQQITLIPHFNNGTITYSVQVNSTTNAFVEKHAKSEKKNVNTKSALQVSDFNRTPVDASSYNNTLKPFTTCADLSPFVESNLDTSNSAEVLDTSSQSIMAGSNDGSITYTPHVTDCAGNKPLAVNFTPLSDLLKCNNILNCDKGIDQNNLTNYQPISLSQLINSISKTQNRSQPGAKAVLNPSAGPGHMLLKTGSSAQPEFNLKPNGKVPSLRNTCTVLNNSNNMIKTTMPSSGDSVLLPPINTNATGKTSLVRMDGHSAVEPALSNSPTQVANKSITAVLPLMSNHVLLNSAVTNQSDDTSTIMENTIRVPALSSSSNDFKAIDSINSTCAATNISTDSNKTPISLSSLTESLLSDTGAGGKLDDSHAMPDFHNRLTCSSSTASSSELTTIAPSSGNNTKTATATTAAITTSSVATPTPLPTVKSIKALDNKCVLPKEVSAALNRLPLLNNTNKPLGSSENPIQLVQQGQTFHSAQALTADQLKQVTTVLQQNNLGTSIPAKNILYDAETNTKIIYRVVYPEEFDLKEASMSTDEVNSKTRKRGRPSLKSSLNKDSAANAPDENTVVKRKQPLPRTRSGRLSRPPRYMVRDYKRIKRSELDDSDGAYSDYQSEQEEDSATGEKNLLPGLLLPQKRNISSTFRCPTCNKIYLGYRRMAHHFDKYSDHGTEEYLMQLKKACENKQLPPYNAPVTFDSSEVNGMVYKSADLTIGSDPGVTEVSTNNHQLVNGQTSTETTIASVVDSVSVTNNESINLSDNLHSMNTQNIASFGKSRTLNGGTKVGAGFGRRRGRRKGGKESTEGLFSGGVRFQNLAQYQTGLPPEQMKTKLRELLELCDVTELVQVAGPAVCSVLTTWELLLLRVDSMSTCSQQNRVTALCDEIKKLLSRFKELAGSLFQPVDNVIKDSCDAHVTFQMEDKAVSNAFGLPCGVYNINESLLKTEQIINTCRPRPKPKASPACWEGSRIGVDDKQHHLPIAGGVNQSIDQCPDDNGLGVYSESSGTVKACVENERMSVLENRGDSGEENVSAEGGVIETNKEVDICSETHTTPNNISNLSSSRFELVNEGEMLCGDRDGLDDSVEQIVNERLKNLTSQSQDLSKVEVDELIKGFTVLEHGHDRNTGVDHHGAAAQIRTDRSVVLDPSDDLMDGFTSITHQRNHVSASTEDLIKSLENFGSELHSSTCDESSRQDFMNGSDSFAERVVGVNNVNVVDTLDFHVLSQDFHHPNGVNHR